MKILPNNKGLKFKAFDKQIEQDPDNPLAQGSWVSILSGSRGSGKTSAILTMLTEKNMYYKKFEKVFIMSGSVFTDAKWAQIIDLNHVAGVSDVWEDDIIEDWMEECDALKIESNNRKKGTKELLSLVIIDDFAMELKSKSFLHWVLRGRHSNSSFLITTQKYSAAPVILRNNTEMFFIFQPGGHRELVMIRDDLLGPLLNSNKKVDEVLSVAWQKPRGFLFVNRRHCPGHQVYIGFNKVSWEDEDRGVKS